MKQEGNVHDSLGPVERVLPLERNFTLMCSSDSCYFMEKTLKLIK